MTEELFSNRRTDFATTHWSMVVAAGGKDSAEAQFALEKLCAIYWYPLYAYVRRQGRDAESAQDLTQEFFLRLLARNDLQGLDPDKGRFRSYLLAAMKHFLLNQWDRERAARRGGGRQAFSLDFEHAERRYSLEPASSQTPETLFEKRWALALLDQVRSQLEREAAVAGKLEQFRRLQIYLTGERHAPPYAETARTLGTTEAAVKVAVHRLRRGFRDRLRQEIAHTVADPADVDDEIRSLFETLRA